MPPSDLEGSGDHASVEAFVEMCMADEAYSFTFEDVCEIAVQARTSRNVVIKALEGYGLTYEGRPVERKVRGFTANCHDRWQASGNCGGSGWEQISGFAGRNG